MEIVIGSYLSKTIMNPGRSYMKTVTFRALPSMKPGTYNLTVHADYTSQVFEYKTRENNIKHLPLSIQAAFPDLAVIDFNCKVTYHENAQTMLLVNWTVQNIGEGNTPISSWTDRITIRSDDTAIETTLANAASDTTFLPATKIYKKSIVIHMPVEKYGTFSLDVNVDSNRRTSDVLYRNNKASATIIIPLRTPDLFLQSFQSTKDVIYSGDNVAFRWIVFNGGINIANSQYWTDEVKLSLSGDASSKYFYRTIRRHNGPLVHNSTYTDFAELQIPEYVVGFVFAHVFINAQNDVFEGHQVPNNIRRIPLKVVAPESPDLVTIDISHTVHKVSNYREKLIVVTWKVRNNGNSMKGQDTWSDEIGLISDRKSYADKTILALIENNYAIEYGATYTKTKTLVLPYSLEGFYFLYVISDARNELKEINGESNNDLSEKVALEISRPEPAKLKARILHQSPCGIALICLSFVVENKGDLPTDKTSWVDGIYSVVSESTPIQNIFSEGNLLKRIQHIGVIRRGQRYTVNTSIDMSANDRTTVILAVLPDIEFLQETVVRENISQSNQTCNDCTQQFTWPTLDISLRFALPNLHSSFSESIGNQKSGQPMNISFNITNNGEADLANTFYVAFYITSDPNEDLYERKIKVIWIHTSIDANCSEEFVDTIFLPTGLQARNYFLVLQTDSRNEILETNELDNIALTPFTVTESVAVDVVVSNVIGPWTVSYDGVIDVGYALTNNGSNEAHGYKCDYAYLSKDDFWDINDKQIGDQVCRMFTLTPNDGSQAAVESTISGSVPSDAVGSYKILVKSIGNVDDFNQLNNIAAGENETHVILNTLPLHGQVTTTLTPGVTRSFRIQSVPGDNTLIVTSKSKQVHIFHDIMARYGGIATEFKFDFQAKDPFRSDQRLTIPNTRDGDYFILVKYSASISAMTHSEIEIQANIAEFEIFSVFPNTAAPLGNVTLRIFGSLFPDSLQIQLFNKTVSLNALDIYWYSSTSAAATFDIRGLRLHSTYSLRMVSIAKNMTATITNALFIQQGREGVVEARIDVPGPLLFAEIDAIHINVQNVGNTDVRGAIIIVRVDSDGTLRYVNDYIEADRKASHTLLCGSLEGPSGILAPSEIRQFTFEAALASDADTKRRSLKSGLHVSIIQPSLEHHSYLNMKRKLQPTHYSNEIWDSIWDNFLMTAGLSWRSLNNKLSDVADAQSIAGKRQSTVSDLIQTLLNMADGTGPFRYIHTSVDLKIDISLDDHYSFLNLLRVYPVKVGMRKTIGAMGKGWIMPYW